MNINHDDPKWTAYVLGELDESERAAMDALLESSEEARAFVEELRSAASALTLELKDEMKTGMLPPNPVALTPEQRAALTTAAEKSESAETGQLRQFRVTSRVAIWAGGLAVAALILFAVAMPSRWHAKNPELASRSIDEKQADRSAVAEKNEKEPVIPAVGPTVAAAALQAAAKMPAGKNSSEVQKETLQQAAQKKEETAVAAPTVAPIVAPPAVPPVIAEQIRSLPLGGGNTVSVTANGPANSGSISGIVQDMTKALIPGVLVTATNIATGAVDTRLTNNSGVYSFPNVPPGNYRLTAELAGFKKSQTDIPLVSSAQTQVNMTLQIGTGGSAVTVQEASNAVHQTSSSVGTTLSDENIHNLPLVSSNVLDLLTVLPGYRQNANGTAFDTVGGLGLDTVNATINGMTTNNARQQSGQGQGIQLQQLGQGQGQAAGAPGGRGGGGAAGGGRGGGAPAAGGARGAAPAAAAGPPPAPPAPPYPGASRPLLPDNPTVIRAFDTPTPYRNDAYATIIDNPFRRVSDEPLSTFSSDVDTASYSNIRRFMNQGQLPPRNAVRIEEMLNYFPYDYAPPSGKDPIGAQMEIASAPWNPAHRLVRIGIKARDIDARRRPASNLVFLLDVSGSMGPAERLPLIKRGLKMMVEELTDNDRVSIVVYAGSSGVALQPTSGSRKDVINRVIDSLEAGGSTNGSGGIQLAYQLATANFIKGGVNRVILATDGDFNVGVVNQNDLVRLIQDRARTGVFLSVLGVGTDNLQDSTMEKLADSGNGHYAYIDSLNEAHKVLVEEMSGTLVTVAKDVKLQVEFNPAFVEAYRLIGYEDRVLANADFNNDRKDAGDMGAGHTVTALYEIVPRGGTFDGPSVDQLKYQSPAAAPVPRNGSNETLTLKIRYKDPDGTESKLMSLPLVDREAQFSKASADFRFAASVAEFGMILRSSPYRGNASVSAVLENAQESKGPDRGGYRQEFIGLVQRARSRGLN